MVDAVRPTYGPIHRTVMLSRVSGEPRPEILDDGGLIARRIYALPDRDEDVGAMMVRHLMWRMRDRFGDGTVTAALIYQQIFEQGARHVAQGGNAMLLRRHLEAGAKLVAEAIDRQVLHVDSQEQLTHLAESICRNSEVARSLGEIFSRVGQYGQVEIRPHRGRSSQVEYIHGMTCKGEFFSRSMVQDIAKVRSQIENPAILVSNLHITDPYELAVWLERVFAAGVDKLVIIAKEISQEGLLILDAVNRSSPEMRVLAINLYITTERWEMQDLTIETGAALIAQEAGLTLDSVAPEHLGRADQVWLERNRFGIIGGGGNPQAIEEHFRRLLRVYQEEPDKDVAERLRQRIARLAGMAAIYHVGGATTTEIEETVQLASRTANTMREALAGGVVPGGGAALLGCLPALDAMIHSADLDERAAGRIIAHALQEPVRLLLHNCGENPSEHLARLRACPPGWGFDVRTRQLADMVAAGILDVANVVKAAAYGGIIGAALGLTADVVVHPRKRKQSYTTG